MGLLSSLVTRNNSLQIFKSIIRHATIESQFVIVQFRKLFSFRKWLANTSNLIIGQSSVPPVISQNMDKPNMATDDILQSITVLQATE